MITVGLIKELRFLACASKSPVVVHLHTSFSQGRISIKVTEDRLKVFYGKDEIWVESLEDSISMFGVESCDTLARIIGLIDSGDDKVWRTLVFTDK